MTKDMKITLGEIAKALAYNDFVYFYQPIVSLSTGNVCGAEALIRWRRTDGSLVPPAAFIPIAEETGFITEITLSMLPKLLADMTAIHQTDASLSIALNTSMKDLSSNDFAENVLQLIKNHQVNPYKLCIEITESHAIEQREQIQNTIFALDAEGLQIAIDDYGAGYSSIGLIRDFPISVVKIDQSFVGQIFDSPKCVQIVRHSISLSHQLEIATVGEGVETQAVHEYLICYGCDFAQGYYYSKPLPLSDFLAFISQRNYSWVGAPLGLIHLAQQDHLDWRRDLIREILIMFSEQDGYLKQKAYERLPPLDQRKCLLGKWLAGAGKEYQGVETFYQVGIEHERVHETAKLLVHAARSGTSQTQVVELIWSLVDQGNTLMRKMQELHTSLALEAKNLAARK